MDSSIHTILEDANWNIRCQYALDEPNKVIIHCNVYNWSHTLLKGYLNTWEDVLKNLKDRGIVQVGTVVEVGDDKLLKFATMFGFNIAMVHELAHRECYIMMMDT